METLKKIIEPKDKSIRELLDNVKYTIDFCQREYTWEKKHIEQLINDLTSKFLSNYEKRTNHEREEVEEYTRYYLGSILLFLKDGQRSIIDGQQRLTSITLLLIFLNNLQKDKPESEQVKKISELIFSEKFSKKSFNLQVDDRTECIEALYKGEDYDANGKSESVRKIVDRYEEIEELFPDELKGKVLPYFIDWFIENVILVEISTYSDDDAYAIFETMNDRGKNLTPTEMLKGYILSQISNHDQKTKLDNFWKNRVSELNKIDEELEFFRAWLRAKYAETIRPGKKGAENEDFEKIGTRFHSWIRDNKEKLGLNSSDDYFNFVMKEFDFFSNLHLKIYDATVEFDEKLQSIYFIQERGLALSLYPPLLLSPIKSTDSEAIVEKKLRLVSLYLEMFVVFRAVNRRNYSQTGIRYTMYNLVKEIRNKEPEELLVIFKKKVSEFEENLSGMRTLILHGQNKRFIKFLLARITTHIEKESGIPTKFNDYISSASKKPFEIEHILADKFDEHKEEFKQRDEFEDARNSVGALLLIQRGFNQSYGAIPYKEKLPHYYGQNLLAKSLTHNCYDRNSNFLSYVTKSGIPFKAHPEFKKQDIDARTIVYTKICEEIYDIREFDKIVEGSQ